MRKVHKMITYQKGFSLIELIAVLVLVGLLVSLAGMGIVTGVRGYLMAAENADITQKAQLAMTRLSREILECETCSGSPGNIGLPFNYENNLGSRRIELVSGGLRIGSPGDTHLLVDQVSNFTLARGADGRITLDLRLNHRQGGGVQIFQTSIFPRNPDIYE